MANFRNKVSDRREMARYLLLEDERFLVQLDIDNRVYEGQINHLSKNGVTLTCQGQLSLPIERLEQLELNCQLRREGQDSFVSLPQLKVRRLRSKSDASFQLFLSPKTPQAKAMIWDYLNLQRPTSFRESTRTRQEEEEGARIPARGHYTEKARSERIAFIRDKTLLPLPRLDSINLVPDKLSSNIENLVGSVEIPVGLGGPLLFRGEQAKGILYAPFATTEGALVASLTRGATAMTRSGGVATRVLSQQMIRVPFFRFTGLHGSLAFTQWLHDFFDEIRDQTKKTSRFAQLIALDPLVSGSTVHVRFIYETGDAAGQNMTTTCTWHACMWILEQLKLYPDMHVEHFMIDSNVSGDKKVNFMSFIKGRGIRVTAECFLHEEDLQKVLKVDSHQLAYAFHLISQGAHNTGSMGINVNVANTIAAIFTATGQDIACVHESSLAILNIECVEGGIYASMLLPSLIVGTVGGGTSLPDQNQYLQIIGCQGAQHAHKLAEVIAGYCLALDLSTLSALASGQFAIAHEKLGRNRPIQHLSLDELNPAFFTKHLASLAMFQGKAIQKVELQKKDEEGSSILTELTSRRLSKLMGLFPFQVQGQEQQSLRVMVKIKPMDNEVILMLHTLAAMCGSELAKAFRQHQQHLGFVQCHSKELAIYRQDDPRFREFTPHCYAAYEQADREIYLLILENIEGMDLLNSVNHPEHWKPEKIRAMIPGLAALHSLWWKKDAELREKPWIGVPLQKESMIALSELWQGLAIHAAKEFSDWFDQDLLAQHAQLVRTLGDWWSELDKLPKTLIHNDFNPRNIAMRQSGQGYKLCAYDWELATIGLPQQDLAEFLCFVLDEETQLATLEEYVELHRQQLLSLTGDTLSSREWKKGFALSLRNLLVNRIPMYIMGHTMHHYRFIKRVTHSCRHLLRITETWL